MHNLLSPGFGYASRRCDVKYFQMTQFVVDCWTQAVTTVVPRQYLMIAQRTMRWESIYRRVVRLGVEIMKCGSDYFFARPTLSLGNCVIPDWYIQQQQQRGIFHDSITRLTSHVLIDALRRNLNERADTTFQSYREASHSLLILGR